MNTSSFAAALCLLAPIASAQDVMNNLRSSVSNAERNLGGPNDNGKCNGICNAIEKACDGGCTGPARKLFSHSQIATLFNFSYSHSH